MTAIHGYGAQLLIGGRSGDAVAACKVVGGPKVSTASLSAGAHDSASATLTYVPGMKDPGQVTIEIIYDPNDASHDNVTGGLWKLWSDRTVDSVAVQYPTTPARGFEFDAFITGIEPNAPFEDLLTATVTFQVTGPITNYTVV